jgi:hypothetical protein
MTFASGTISSGPPTAEMRCPSVMTTAFVRGAPPVPSIRRPTLTSNFLFASVMMSFDL